MKHLSKSGFTNLPNSSLPADETFALDRSIKICMGFYSNNKSKSKETQPKTTQKSDFATHPRDAEGFLIPPVHINSLTILDFGKVSSKPGFHSDKNFFPIGWVSVRDHMSMRDPSQRSSYKCTILHKNEKPVYRIVCDEEGLDAECPTATACWQIVNKAVNEK